MEKRLIKYYLVDGIQLYCSSAFLAYVYTDNKGEWSECDYNKCIADYLNGFDESEPLGSPYRYGNYSISRLIEEISEEEVIKRIGKKAVLDSFILFAKGGKQ